jgi:hypothetical protein
MEQSPERQFGRSLKVKHLVSEIPIHVSEQFLTSFNLSF